MQSIRLTRAFASSSHQLEKIRHPTGRNGSLSPRRLGKASTGTADAPIPVVETMGRRVNSKARSPNEWVPTPREEKRMRHLVKPEWAKHKETIKKTLGSWNPPKKLSREAMDLIRKFHAADPDMYSTPMLAQQFKVSPEAIRRILRSRFVMSPARERELDERTERLAAERAERRALIRAEKHEKLMTPEAIEMERLAAERGISLSEIRGRRNESQSEPKGTPPRRSRTPFKRFSRD